MARDETANDLRVVLRTIIVYMSDSLGHGLGSVVLGDKLRVALKKAEKSRIAGQDRAPARQGFHDSLVHAGGIAQVQMNERILVELWQSGMRDVAMHAEQYFISFAPDEIANPVVVAYVALVERPTDNIEPCSAWMAGLERTRHAVKKVHPLAGTDSTDIQHRPLEPLLRHAKKRAVDGLTNNLNPGIVDPATLGRGCHDRVDASHCPLQPAG